MLHGLTPGPMLFQENPDFVWTVIASFYVGNVALLIINLPLANLWAKVILVPYKLLYPFILIFCIIGAYSINNQVWDIGVMLLFGVIGYLMKKLDIPMTATVLTFVLGQQIESALVQSLIISQGSWLIFFQRPVSAALMGLVAIILVVGIYSSVKNKRDMLADDLEV
ncbi:hypothetical protein AXX12_06735 [Anaerosporomusa subterranea]|uniref:DUF112 domain-containing protein n=1 Tax=Anaerosporomusa subterranea TaxID=1794912 RepID=A0A154BQ35_ANASB|nr:tripartite tricarboxylate transporter permease [Anaerosporomusa subterranea]KYZ76133.1 hypothetical protein AXX12_06735 [Anaerosporomusa subterranea]